MISTGNNPWEKMHLSSVRRVDRDTPFNYFWLLDENGRYGLLIKFNSLSLEDEIVNQLKGITIISRLKEDGSTDIFYILNNNSEWEMFVALCQDLLTTSDSSTNERELFLVLMSRLKRWQIFLSQNSTRELSERKQMGLFAELLILRDYVIPKFGTSNSITSWTGPQFDKQDFSFDGFFIEVKSFVSSKSAIVQISSLHQLLNTIKPLYMTVIGLSRNENGRSIVDLIFDISALTIKVASNCNEVFESKLAEYGYIHGFTIPPFYAFNCDNIQAFTIVDSFPRITPATVANQIISAEYKIDLTRCQEFRIDINTIFSK